MSALARKQTFAVHERVSALGQKQTFALHQPMSALPPKATSNATYGIADIAHCICGVRRDVADNCRVFSSIDIDSLLRNKLLARVFGVSEHTRIFREDI